MTAELDQQTAEASSGTAREDLDAIRDRILANLKLGKQAPGYKAAAKALDQFIALCEGGGAIATELRRAATGT